MRRLAEGLASILLVASGAVQAQQMNIERNDPLVPVIHDYIQRVMEQKTDNGKVVIDVVPTLTDIGTCQAPSPFMPTGQLMRGNITVGVKCINAQGREIPRYYRAHVGIEENYLVASRDLIPGTILHDADISSMRGDITRLPGTLLTDAAPLIGQRIMRRVVAGAPLQAGMTRAAPVIARNSRVTVTARTSGFTITAQGTALDEATSESQFRVRMDSKKIIMARATAPGEAMVIQ